MSYTMMDDWERHVTPLLQDMCPNEETHDDFFNQQDVSHNITHLLHMSLKLGDLRFFLN